MIRQQDPQLYDIASSLYGAEVISVSAVSGGGNNRVYHLEGMKGPAALKFYPPQSEDPRDRLGHEYDGLSFLSKNGVDKIPRPLAIDRSNHCAVYQWIEGESILENRVEDVDRLAHFLLELQSLRDLKGARKIRNAADSCFSFKEVVDHLRIRLTRLQEVADQNPLLDKFLKGYLLPLADSEAEQLRDKSKLVGLRFDEPLPQQFRALSPSDFGFHNALRQKNGELCFLDFEYFGWEDPVKMINNVMFHAGMNLSNRLAEHFRQRMYGFFETTEESFALRFELLYPLYGLTWCCILLNEFLPERWERRVAAGHTDIEASQARQLKKAKTLFDRLNP